MVQPPHALPMIPEVMLSLNQKNGRLFSLQIRLRLETAVRDWNPHFLNAKAAENIVKSAAFFFKKKVLAERQLTNALVGNVSPL